MPFKNIVYHGSWFEHGRLPVAQIDASIATDFNLAFMNVTSDGAILCPKDDFPNEQLLKNFVALKRRNSNAEVNFSVGGWKAGRFVFSQIAANSTSRAALARNALAMCKKYGFDGFDLDWEFPDQHDRENFTHLCREIYTTLKASGKTFSIAVKASPSTAGECYDIKNVHHYVDYINLMTYDFYGAWSPSTGIHAALRADTHYHSSELNVEACVNWWISQGVPRKKLIVGLAAYGCSFTLASSSNHGINAPKTGPGIAGEAKQPGHLSYKEIQQKINREGWKRVWEDTQKVPYAYKGNQWVGYDDEESINHKLNFVVRNNLGGVMWWCLGDDDHQGVNGRGTYPLIRLAQNRLA